MDYVSHEVHTLNILCADIISRLSGRYEVPKETALIGLLGAAGMVYKMPNEEYDPLLGALVDAAVWVAGGEGMLSESLDEALGDVIGEIGYVLGRK